MTKFLHEGYITTLQSCLKHSSSIWMGEGCPLVYFLLTNLSIRFDVLSILYFFFQSHDLPGKSRFVFLTPAWTGEKKYFNYLTPSVDCDTGRSKYRCKQIPRWQAATAPKLRSVTANPRCYRSREVWRDDTDLGFPSRSRVTRLPPYNNPYSLSSHSLASAKRAAPGGRGGRVRGCREETQLPPSGRCV